MIVIIKTKKDYHVNTIFKKELKVDTLFFLEIVTTAKNITLVESHSTIFLNIRWQKHLIIILRIYLALQLTSKIHYLLP